MDMRKTYTSEGIDVEYGPRRCIHFAECVRSLPQVFDTRRRPWIKPDEADAHSIAQVVQRCPTGALHFVRKDGGPSEAIPETNTLVPGPHGPLYLHGEITLVMPDGVEFHDTRIALCRCGYSQNKPFCDNSHQAAGFRDPGQVQEAPAQQDAAGGGPLRVAVQAKGPYVLKGNFFIQSSDGERRIARRRGALCRCGHSQNKPFCDGTHAQIVFPDGG